MGCNSVNKINGWKVLSIFLFIIIVFISISTLNKEKIQLKEFSIEKETLEEIANTVPYDTFYLCKIKENKCVTIQRTK